MHLCRSRGHVAILSDALARFVEFNMSVFEHNLGGDHGVVTTPCPPRRNERT